MLGYYDLPRYLRRDLKRIYAPFQLVQDHLPMGDLINLAGAHIDSGNAVIVDHLAWRVAADGFGARQVERMFTDRLGCGSEYRRRGDLLIFFGRPC